MKKLIPTLFLIFIACNDQSKAGLLPPPDSVFIKILTDQYTAGNENDGAEFATVDTLYILSKEPADMGAWNVKYHVKVHYNAPAMGPEYERTERPGIDVDSVEMIDKGAY